MKLNVATNWDLTLLDDLARIKEVKNILGRKHFLIPDSGQIISESEREKIEKYVSATHDKGLIFTFVVGTACLGNLQFESHKKRMILEFFQWLSDIRVDAVTLSNYILISLVKAHFPELKVGVSSQSLMVVDDSSLVAQYVQLGCDWIDINCSANRDFDQLKLMKNELKSELRLTVQNLCAFFCPYAIAHKNYLSHSLYINKEQNDIIDFCSLICTKMYMKKPESFLKARWIRPEDLICYEQIGYDSFNIIDYSLPSSEKILRTVKAYADKSFEGNLFTILSKDISSKLTDYSEIANISNKRLDGFLKHFTKCNCRYEICEDCGYCRSQADNLITINDVKRHDLLKSCEEDLAALLADS